MIHARKEELRRERARVLRSRPCPAKAETPLSGPTDHDKLEEAHAPVS
jgi:hypothetical protein